MRLLALLVAGFVCISCTSTEKIYIGTSSNEGMFLVEFNEKNGTLNKIYQQNDVKKPGFLTISPNKKFLYTVASGNKIKAYKIEKNSELTFINEKDSSGKGPCHIEISKSAKAIVVANYGSGDTTVISVAADGSLSGAPRNHSHKKYPSPGTKKPQSGPRAHNVKMSPDGRYVFVSDLGLDKILVYKFDDNYEKLTRNKPEYINVATGAGPRHFTFHPNGKFAYVINELDSSVSAFHYLGEGKLSLKQSIGTKPKSWTEANNCADIHIHPNGKFLYGSNRGNNSIVIFKINQRDGTLSLIGHESTRGNWPRNFAISPSGKYLLAANQKSSDIYVFEIDQDTGKLNFTGNSLELPNPICIKFVKQ